MQIDLKKLQKFLTKASASTYAGNGEALKNPEKAGFIELVYEEGGFSYRDSYTGHFRSRGMELIRLNSQPIWASLYGGGMVKGKEKLADQTFSFLKKAFLSRAGHSVRGPSQLKDSDWQYTYKQEGNLEEFSGHEEIYFKGDLIFFHRIIGGVII